MCPPTVRINRVAKHCRECGRCAIARKSGSLNSSSDCQPRRKSISLLLGGGGAKAAAHLGVLNILDRAGLPIQSVFGSSAGALVALFYCAGYHPRELVELMQVEMNSGFAWRWVPGMGLARLAYYLRWGGLRRLIRRHIRFKNIEQLPRELTVMTSDLITGQAYPLRSGNIESAILASMSLPGLGRPVRHHDRWLVDGSFVNDLPVDLAQADRDRLVVAVDLNDSAGSPNRATRPSAWAGLFLPMVELARRQAERADFVIRPKFQPTDWTNFSILMDLVARGETATHSIVARLSSQCSSPLQAAVAIPKNP